MFQHPPSRPAPSTADIDFVLLWVDGGDPAWREKKARYTPPEASTANIGDERYRDWGLLRYWFRGVEQFAPWVRKVFFVTDDQWPDWLDFDAPKLVRVKHSDFMPEECLPTFSSTSIEMYLHRIPGLSERFVEFNDDMFLCRPIKPDFYFRNGLPSDEATLEPLVASYPRRPHSYMMMNDVAIANRHSRHARYIVATHPSKWLFPWNSGLSGAVKNAVFGCGLRFPGFHDPHLPFALLKSTIEDVWKAEPDILRTTALNKFRHHEDATVHVFRFWQFVRGTFVPRRPGTAGKMYCIIPQQFDGLVDAVANRKHPVICANDMGPLEPGVMDDYRKRLQAAFESILPEPSSFERAP